MNRLLGILTVALSTMLCIHPGTAQQKNSENRSESGNQSSATAGEVTYVVAKSSIGADGKKWALALEATSKGGDRKIFIQAARAITPEGKTFDVKLPMGKKPINLPEDTKILIELSMGDLPKSVSTLARVELIGDRTVGVPGLEFDRKAKGKSLEPRPLVLKNVRVDRSDK